MANSILYLNWRLLTDEMSTALKEFPAECQRAVWEIDDFQKRVFLYVIHHLDKLYVITVADASHKSILSLEQHEHIQQMMRQGIFKMLQPEQREHLRKHQEMAEMRKTVGDVAATFLTESPAALKANPFSIQIGTDRVAIAD